MNALESVNNSRLAETGIARRLLAQGDMLHVAQDDVRLPDGGSATREFIIHPGAVMVVPLLDDGRLVLERQYRYPMGKVMIEFPAGKLDKGESSLACAQRELREETGFIAMEWAFAGTIHPVISYSTEHIDVWFARRLESGPRELDTGEFLEVFSATADDLLHWCLSGVVTDAKTLSGFLWLQNHLAGRWPLAWAGSDPHSHPQPAGPRLPCVEAALP